MEISTICGESGRTVFPSVPFQLPDVGKILCRGAWVHGKVEESLFGPGGLRLYVDGYKFEVCTGEASSPRELVCAERQVESIAVNIQDALGDLDYPGSKVLLSTEANSGGFHINYQTTDKKAVHEKSKVLNSLISVVAPLFGDGGFALSSLFNFVAAPRTDFRASHSKSFFGFRDGHCKNGKGSRVHIMAFPYVRSEKSRLLIYTLLDCAIRLIESKASFPGELIITSPKDTVRAVSANTTDATVDTLVGETDPVSYLNAWVDFILWQKNIPTDLANPAGSIPDFIDREFEAGKATGNIDWLLKREACEWMLYEKTNGRMDLSSFEVMAKNIEAGLSRVTGGKKALTGDGSSVEVLIRRFLNHHNDWPNATGEHVLELLEPVRHELEYSADEIVEFSNLRLAMFKMIKVEWNAVAGIFDKMRDAGAISPLLTEDCSMAADSGIVSRATIRAKAIDELYQKYNTNGVMPRGVTASWSGICDGPGGRRLRLKKTAYQKGGEPNWEPIKSKN